MKEMAMARSRRGRQCWEGESMDLPTPSGQQYIAQGEEEGQEDPIG